MQTKRGLLPKVLGAASDQVLLSFVNFAVSLALIRHGTKADYGLYVLLLGAMYLAQGVQNAMLISPFSTRCGGFDKDSSDANKAVYWGQIGFVSICSVIGVVGAYIMMHSSKFDSVGLLPLSFGAALAGWLLREWSRSINYAHGNVGKALWGNAAYSGVLALGVLLGVLNSSLELSCVFFSVAVGGFVSAIGCLRNVPTRSGVVLELREFWLFARWAVFGVVLAWINSNLYPYLVAEKFGLDAVGELNAARLFLMPFVVLVPAWGSLFRPIVIRWFSDGKICEIRRLILLSIIYGSIAVSCYGVSLFVFYDELSFILGAGYEGLGGLVLVWSIYYLCFIVRNILQAVMFVDEPGYRKLAKNSWFAFFLFIPSMYFGLNFGLSGVVIALGCIEAMQAISVFVLARRYLSGISDSVARVTG